MQTILKSPRNGCGLHGAVATASSIGGVVPIVHSNAGCAMQNYLAGRAGGVGYGRVCGESIPATNAQERHIIFGGASRLREQIKNTLKVVNGDLYIVLNSCESAMVGDDVEAMTREAREQGEPVIECLTAGFHGDCHYGYETVMTDLIQKLPKVREIVVETDAKLVNLFGILPEKEVYFRGNLEVIKRALESIGIRVNTFFGSANGVEELANAQNAALNLVFSKWGLAPAKKLEELYHIPALTFSALPIGVEETADFVAQVAAALKIEETLVNAYLDEERKRFDYYYESVLEDAFENGAARTVAVVGDESYIAGVAGFLHTYLGAQIAVAVVTDGADGKTASDVLSTIAKEVYVTADGKEIDDILIHSDVELILGSSLERTAAEKKGVVNLEISSPIYNQTITNKSYAGVDGALTLLEDYLSAVQKPSTRFCEYFRH